MKSFTSHICRIAVLLGVLLSGLCTLGQSRFNVRFDAGFPATIISSVLELSDGYMCTGFLADSLDGFEGRPMFAAKFDADGQQQFLQTFGGQQVGSDMYFSAQNPDLAWLNDSTLIFSSVVWDAQVGDQFMIVHLNLAGDTLHTQRFLSPSHDLDPEVNIRQVSVSADQQLLLGMIHSTGFAEGGAEVGIQKRALNGELLWEYSFATTQANDDNYSWIPTSDGGMFLIPHWLPPGEEDVLRSIVRLNSDGAVDEQTDFGEETFNGGFRDAVLQDGHLIGALRKQNADGTGISPALVKMDLFGNVVWHTPISDQESGWSQRGNQVAQTNDGGFVLGGDTFWLSGSGNDQHAAFLSRYTADGEHLWTRTYAFLETEAHFHSLRDLESTADGGFVFCGESRDESPEAQDPFQQGWLVKVDEHGCLVPGCELEYAVHEQDASSQWFMLGPNPVEHTLIVSQLRAIDQTHRYELWSSLGQTVRTFPSSNGLSTFLLDVVELPAGRYQLVLRDDQTILQSTQVIIY